MRIIFVDMQNNGFVMKSLKALLLRDKVGAKYADLIKELIDIEGVSVCNYITSKGSSLFSRVLNNRVAKYLGWLEFKIDVRINGFAGNKIKTIINIDDVSKDDIVFAFIHSRVDFNEIGRIRARKLLHLNEYNYNPLGIIKDDKVGLEGFIAESNLMKIPGLFREVLTNNNKIFYVVPYIVSKRFKMMKKFSERKNKALATGTIGMCTRKESFEYYKTNYLHGSMRIGIYEQKQKLLDYLDSIITPYLALVPPYVESMNEYVNKKYIVEKDNFICKFYKILYRIFTPVQKKYFSIDIVEKYNDYKMCVVPEEIIGIPAIGTFEGMACGCAAIALDHCMYTDLGLLPNVHYIVYDGTINSLKEKIAYYQTHENELEEIANNGYNFVKEHFTSSEIARKFVNDLRK